MAAETQMTQEQLIANFGPEVGAQMWAQMTASNSGGNQAPFPFLKKIAMHGSELGAFGEYCFNVKTEKRTDGTIIVTDKGDNIGTSFEFIIVNVSYRYKRWDAVKERTVRSNVFETLDGIKTAVDVFSGEPLPESKEDKKEAGWKLVRINAGLVRKDSKSEWSPVIWETDGKLYYTLGEVVKNQPNNGLLSGVAKIVTKLEAKGTTQFSVLDIEKSKFGPLPKDFFSMKVLGDITSKMTEYRNNAQYSAANASQGGQAPTQQAPAADTQDETDW